MSMKCPICGAEYEEERIKFCTVCMYSIGTDRFLTDLLNHPSEEDLEVYNAGIEEYRALWRERNPEKKIVVSGLVEMVEVEGGTFLMGSNEDYFDEKLIQKVTLSSFLMGKNEVTQEIWEIVMGDNPSNFKGSKRPVEKVSWYDAVEFCNKLSEKEGLIPAYSVSKEKEDPNNQCRIDKLKWTVTCDFTTNGYRLPTEAEWEYAARGGNKGQGYRYSGGNEIEEVAWYKSYDNSRNQTQNEAKFEVAWYGSYNNTETRIQHEGTYEVGKKKPNELGIYDMSGNVWEWCWDWYGDSNSSSKTNPRGANSSTIRVYRGGSWDSSMENCHVAYRDFTFPYCRYESLGFRVARTKS